VPLRLHRPGLLSRSERYRRGKRTKRGRAITGCPRAVCKARQVMTGSTASAARGGEVPTVALDATPLLGVPTGVGVFCREALGALPKTGRVDTRAFAVSWRRRQMLQGHVPQGVRIVGRAMPARPLQLAWRYTELPDVEWFIGDVDVVHGTNFVVPPARKAARVVTVHDLTIVRFPEMCEPATLRFAGLVRRAVAHGAWVHTPSEFVAREVVTELGADPSRVRAVHHGVPSVATCTGVSRPDNPAIELPAGVSRYVLAIGTAEPRKDLPGLVRAFDGIASRFSDVALVLVGQQGWGSEALESAVERARWRARIVMPGYVPDETLARLLTEATVLAYPSLYEGFGLPALEAMAAGVAVVTTSAGALPEVVGDCALMVEPGDSDALAGALEKILEDETMRIALVDKGRARAREFTWDACADGLVGLYEDAMKSR
jgi:glycosyltransferase involved in cell wall biosynthesis